jgi:anti-sigma B factor antagonist
MDLPSRELDESGRLKLVELRGEMDALLAASVEKGIESVIEGGCRGLVLDMSGVEYIDSSGIRVLLATYKRLVKLGGKMNILNPSARVVTILELAALTDILKIVKTQEEAVEDLSRAP